MNFQLKKYLIFLKNFLKKNLEIIILLFLGAILFISLFVSNFNFLKLLIFLSLLILLSLLSYLYYLKIKIPKEEKIDLFLLVKKLIENLQEGIVFYDDELKIYYANKKFAEMVEISQESLSGLVVGQWMLKNKNYEKLGNIFFPFIQGEEIKIISEKPVEVISVKFSLPEEKYFLISYLEIFLDKPYKVRLVFDKTEDVIEANKKLEFIQLVSHNLLTPLSEIRWQLESIDKEKLEEDERAFLENAFYITQTAIVFAQNMLTFLKVEKGKVEIELKEFSLEETIRRILKILERKIAEKGLEVNVEIYEKVKNILGDPIMIFLSLFSLIENAVVYNKQGGKVFIKAQKEEGRPYVLIEIEDTGIGMTNEDKENLFKKYYRSKKAKEMEVSGFGIGLYLTKTIIDLYGGKIEIESEENRGTKVKVSLPLEKNLIPL